MQVTGDINTLFRDLGGELKKEQMKRVELGSYANKRGVIAKAKVCLDVLSKIVNDDDIDKTLQDSTWGNKVITDAHTYYAVTDAVVVLKVYNTLSNMSDLSVQLDEFTSEEGLLVDMLPQTGDMTCLASKVGEGIVIITTDNWITPIGVSPAIMNNSRTHVLIEFTLVTAPHVELRDIKIDGPPARLSDSGEPPFRLMTRQHMIRYREITRTTNNKIGMELCQMPHMPVLIINHPMV
jgi:hypothetical protein